jgi:hypothetical protein
MLLVLCPKLCNTGRCQYLLGLPSCQVPHPGIPAPKSDVFALTCGCQVSSISQAAAAPVRFPCGSVVPHHHVSMRRQLLFSARAARSQQHLTSAAPKPLRRVRHASTSRQPNIAAILAQAPSSTTTAAESLPRSDGLISVNGFVRTVRKQKRVAFASVGDGSSLHSLQAVLTPDQAEGSVAQCIRPASPGCNH